MKTSKLTSMKKGWFVGDFEPTLFKTENVEIAVKTYQKGDYEECHHHKLATEITVIVSGRVKMNGVEYQAGDIIIIEPYESTDFEALEDTVNTVVKLPGASNDKYLGRATQ
jgi:quercetin dioxygenase-like cupin family protein